MGMSFGSKLLRGSMRRKEWVDPCEVRGGYGVGFGKVFGRDGTSLQQNFL